LPHSGIKAYIPRLSSIICSQEVITCFTSASIAVTWQPSASQGFSERQKQSAILGLIHNLSDVQPWTAVQLGVWGLAFSCKGQYFGKVTEAFCKKWPPQAKCTTITISRQCHHRQGIPKQANVYGPQFSMVIFTDENDSIYFAGGRWKFLYHASFFLVSGFV